MGLDITAYSNLVHIGQHVKVPELNEGEPDGRWCYYDGHVNAFCYANFPQSFRGIPIIGIDKGMNSNDSFLFGGCYEITSLTQQHSFRAGSYGGYGAWRDDLRAQFNPEVKPELPFYELIHFADNEGSIGPEACFDLWTDFLENRKAYLDVDGGGYDATYDREKYDHWTTAMEIGSDAGLVRFH